MVKSSKPNLNNAISNEMNGESLDIIQDNLDMLKKLFPDIFSEEKIDLEKFKAKFSDEIDFEKERYTLNWAGKADAFKVLQIPTTATLKPQPDQSYLTPSPSPKKGEGSKIPTNEEFLNSNCQNIFIEGENLEVLKVLQKSYYGKVKVICIDPPYNTGNDSFIYPDSFKENKTDYEKRIGDKDEEGYLMKEGLFRKNSKDSGHFHSNWLSMMYPRLFLAKNLLREDGVIFVHIDDNEVHNLRLLMNEIFGEENIIANFIWKKKQGGGNDSTTVVIEHEYILAFSKSIDSFQILLDTTYQLNDNLYPFNDEHGEYGLVTLDKSSIRFSDSLVYEIVDKEGNKYFPRIVKGKQSCWRWGKKKVEEEFYKLVFKDGKVYTKYYRQDGIQPKSLLVDPIYGRTESGNDDIKELFNNESPFSYPKPKLLIKHLVSIASKSEDLILDFFGGSGTTAQAVLELNLEDGGNRKFILVQLPELCDENSEAFKAGYKTIADISKERIRRVIKKIQITNDQLREASELRIKKDGELKFENKENPKNINSDNGFRVFKLSPSNFKIWRGKEITEENLETQLDAFTNPVKEESKTDNILYELILKSGFLLTDKVVLRQAQDKKGNYFSVNDGELIIALDKVNQKLIDTIISLKPIKVLTLDNLFKGNDQLKTNTVLQMRDAGVDFKTI